MSILPSDAKSQAARTGDVNVWPVLPDPCAWWPRRDMPRQVYRDVAAQVRRAGRGADAQVILSVSAASYIGLDADDPTAPGDVEWFDLGEVKGRLSGFAPLTILDWIGAL